MKRKALWAAVPYTVPVMLGYLFLGAAFGVLIAENGFSVLWAFLMSTFIYAGSMQFAAISLMTSAFSPVSAFFLTLMGKRKPYMIFSLTDETYSLLCGVSAPEGIDPDWFLFFISLLDQLYWIIGSCIGAAAGSFLPFDSTGIDFAMTALFLVIFVEQWEKANSRLPALLGLGITLVSLIVVVPDRFLLFSMAGILAALLLFRKEISK